MLHWKITAHPIPGETIPETALFLPSQGSETYSYHFQCECVEDLFDHLAKLGTDQRYVVELSNPS